MLWDFHRKSSFLKCLTPPNTTKSICSTVMILQVSEMKKVTRRETLLTSCMRWIFPLLHLLSAHCMFAHSRGWLI